MADNSERIEQIEAILRSGAKTVTVDGVTTSFDLESLRRELRLLRGTDDTLRGKRPVAARINLGNF